MGILLIVCSITLWLLNFHHLPSKLPVHWDLSGHVNNYDSKLQTFIELHAIMILVYFLPMITPKIDPRKTNYKFFQKSYTFMTTSILFVFFLLNTSILLYGLGYNIQIGKLSFIFIGLLFIVFGNYMPHVRSNFFIGIRNPWTLSNEDIWKKTHRMSGRLFLIIGFCFILLYFLAFLRVNWVAMPLIVSLVAFPMIYSYWLFKKEMKNNK